MNILARGRLYRLIAQADNSEHSFLSFFTEDCTSPLLTLTEEEPGKMAGEYICYQDNSQFVIKTGLDRDGREPVFTAFDDFSVLSYKSYYLDRGAPLLLRSVFDALRYRMLTLGGIVAHGAAAVYGGRAILFCGFSGAGKSTQANLWKHWANAEVINYDKPFIFPRGDGFAISGTPWSGKEPCFVNEEYPLAAIVFVEQAPEDCVVELAPAEAYSAMYYNHLIDPLDDRAAALYENNIAEIIRAVGPVLRLRCTRSKEAVNALYAYLTDRNILEKGNLRTDTMLYVRKEGFMLRNIADELVLIPRGAHSVEFGATIMFNETAAFIWNRLETPCSERELAEALVGEYGIELAKAETDAAGFLAQMQEAGIVKQFA